MNITFDLKNIPDKDTFYRCIGEQMPLPEHFGNNADALYDVITEKPEKITVKALNVQYAPLSVLPALRALRDCDNVEYSEENELLRSDFRYDLPDELIAQHPVEPRNTSRLMCLDRKTGSIEHEHFYDLKNHLREGDLLVLNDSRVIPARLYGRKEDTDGFIEFLLLEQKSGNEWEILVRPGKRARKGARFVFGEGLLKAEITDIVEGGNRIARFECEENIFTVLDRIGQMPLPPYITEKLEDKERYQTVYSKDPGSAAAPTAGLHFTEEQLDDLRKNGINTAFVTLHVGLGTFRPVKEDNIKDHHMHSEHYAMTAETAEMIQKTRKNGGRIISVGTTSTRTLESIGKRLFEEIPHDGFEGYTDIFIYPGKKFEVIDGLITNFHLPESTLIMLVSAFAGYHNTMQAYNIAVKERYRFFSFGDAMLII